MKTSSNNELNYSFVSELNDSLTLVTSYVYFNSLFFSFLFKKEITIPDTAAERLYQATFPQIPQFLVSTRKANFRF